MSFKDICAGVLTPPVEQPLAAAPRPKMAAMCIKSRLEISIIYPYLFKPGIAMA
jgi:hypothetical protein